MALRDEPIRSLQNPALARVREVRTGKDRTLLFLEGTRLVRDSLQAGLDLELLLLTPERAADHTAELALAREARLVEPALLQRVSSLERSPGVLALVRRPPDRPLASLDLAPDGLALGVAGIADPGNLGALARSAEAAGARGLIVVRGGARVFGEKALRGSMGSLLRLPVHEVDDAAAAVSALAARGVRQAFARLDGATPYAAFDYAGPLVLWMPGEVGGDADAFQDLPGVRIPMAGAVESLNVTVAASLLLFAAGRAPRA